MTVVRTPEGRRKSILRPEDARVLLDKSLQGLSVEERQIFAQMLEHPEMVMQVEQARWKRQPVSIEQFLDDPYYMGEAAKSLFPAIRKDLITLFNGSYYEVICGGGIGVGKTYTFSFALSRIIYELSCLANPHACIGLQPGSEIIIPLISKTLNLAYGVMMSAFIDKIRLSPYFMHEFRPQFKTEYTMFPNNIKVIIGSYGSDRIMGTNVLAACLDEANYPPGKRKQVITQTIGTQTSEAHFDIVEKIYTNILTRIKSRLMKAGGYVPGMVILTSSAGTTNSFLTRRIKAAEHDPKVFVRDHVAWTAKPRKEFLGPTFRIICGSSSVQSRIVEEDEEIDIEELDQKNAFVIEVPVEYRSDFEMNLEDNLRDIAGIDTMAISAYIQRLESLEACIRHDRISPFEKESWIAGTPLAVRWHMLSKATQRTTRDGFKEEYWQPLRNPSAPRWIHIDPSLSKDNTGFAMGHISHWLEMERRQPDGRKVVELAPHYVMDVMLAVSPKPGEQIFMGDVRDLVYALQLHGFYIMGVSSDGFDPEMLQNIRRAAGIRTENVSLDKTTYGYDCLKAAIYEKRIEFYNYPPLFAELRALEYDRERGKVDHPQAGKKDVSDSVAGVVYSLAQHIQDMPLERRMFDAEEKPKTQQEMVQRLVYGDLIPGSPDATTILDKKSSSSEEPYFIPVLFG